MCSYIPTRETLTEAEISALLTEWHLFEDHALLRREMVDDGLVRRTADGWQYTRIEQRPPMAAMELLRQLNNLSHTA